MERQAGTHCQQTCGSWHSRDDISLLPPIWLISPAGCCAILTPSAHPQGSPSFLVPEFCHGTGIPSRKPGVPPAHRRVGLNEPVLQATGLLPAALTAQVIQLAHCIPQDIGKGTDAPRGTWGHQRNLAAKLAHSAQLAHPKHCHHPSPACPHPSASPSQVSPKAGAHGPS